MEVTIWDRDPASVADPVLGDGRGLQRVVASVRHATAVSRGPQYAMASLRHRFGQRLGIPDWDDGEEGACVVVFVARSVHVRWC